MKVTTVINMHREKWLANSALRSVQRNLAALNGAGLEAEVILLLDSPDDLTRTFAREFCPPPGRLVEVSCRDLGGARNAAIADARGDYIAFLDADDIWGDEWLLRAYRAAQESGEDVVWHPEASVFFGTAEPYWLVHRDDDILGADWQTLALRNHWTSLCFAPRRLFERVRYQSVEIEKGLGYEDWAFNMDTIAAGYRHRIVRDTLHLVRMRPDSLVRMSAMRDILVAPTNLFIDRIGRSYE
ncbi:glycosyltransferase family 2 protein [Sabulicella rubraurantiaca]|uniref:glycosyltransferase family 2 protein n=1 Tax=Sabulicella rubraurantiaca TaxID=2811429 RepID=UPI001A96BBD7|nr:glycosyltransferase family 2 protein [Sabulicella rubraurantiaca]